MAEDAKTEKKNTKLIAGIIAALVIVAGVAVAIFLVNRGRVIDDNFFKSDDTKYVLTQDYGLNGASRTHTVIYYDKEDNITKWENYLEYSDAESARAAYDNVKDVNEEKSGVKYSINGKYIISEYPKETYENPAASTYKQWFDSLTKHQEEEAQAENEAEDAEETSEEAEE